MTKLWHIPPSQYRNESVDDINAAKAMYRAEQSAEYIKQKRAEQKTS